MTVWSQSSKPNYGRWPNSWKSPLLLPKCEIILSLITLWNCCSVTQSHLALCDPVDWSTSGFPALYYLLEFTQTHVHWISDAIQPFPPLSLPLFLLSAFPSIREFSNVCIRWPKYWSFSFSISPSNEYWGLISLKISWFDLLAVQATLKGLLQHHSWKASILWCSAFFTVQLSQLYVTTWRTIALIIWTFVSRVMSLLFNTLPGFFVVFLPRSNGLLISWLQSLYTMILEPKKRKSVTTTTPVFLLLFAI